jgi:hypothetical protein
LRQHLADIQEATFDRAARPFQMRANAAANTAFSVGIVSC